METVTPDKEIIDLIKQSGGNTFSLCFECGLCDALCPWNRVTDFSMRRLIREAAFGLTEIESGDIWRCTSCGRCPQQCPRGVEQIEFTVSLRRIAVEYGVFPEAVSPIRAIKGSLVGAGNPLNGERDRRRDWAEKSPVRDFTEGTEILYFTCCYLCYDPRMRRTAVATVGLLSRAGVDFGILGVEENCCGESIRRAGFEDVFRRLAKENIKTFIDKGVKKILVSSPHCYHTFKNEYSDFMVNFKVLHISQYLYELMREGRLKPNKDYKKRVVWHDPCYLGRHNGIYEEPRWVLKNIGGLELIEMSESYADSLCCGGGGGRIWMETTKGERFSDIRLREAIEAGAEVLVTSCPYCITNFEDSRLTLNATIEIKEITEILQEVI